MQKVFPEALTHHLSKSLSPFYLLTGNDLLLLNESKAQIIHAAKAVEFDEIQEITINNETKWAQLFESVQNFGLFFSRQIIILNLPENPTTAQMNHITKLAGLINADLMLILCLTKFSKAMEKQAWFTQIDAKLVQVSCQTPDINRLPIWLANRAKMMGLQLEVEVVQLLAYSYEGNLIALQQTLQQLQLRTHDGKITLPQAKEIIEQFAQFTPFQWIDALLEGKIARAIRILKYLKDEETQVVMLLRIVQKELLILLEITRSPTPILTSQQALYVSNLRAEFDRLKIWQNRRPFYQSAIQRLSYKKLYLLIQQLAELEKQTKHAFSEQIWLELEHFSTLFE
ncbi:DNA polymerase III subunit delta [[Haemophilus] ducreyi]|uniref:DNA polymerase III subunit delta n=1 Tax=Haemophilus ducreyi TaxID=730 RepID=UPI0007CDC8BE|nr:DNA polymerase III subunit delta [[Haemophilus] ducreyi]ANF67668.1 DNA polymerase III subunit delta [[Haemophilus] ducreyi]ANF69766.1 DNA polymerase III subunit delta [[Haemophilus] ducreyi]